MSGALNNERCYSARLTEHAMRVETFDEHVIPTKVVAPHRSPLAGDGASPDALQTLPYA